MIILWIETLKPVKHWTRQGRGKFLQFGISDSSFLGNMNLNS